MKRDKEFVRAAEKCREYRIKSNQCGKNKKLEIKSPSSTESSPDGWIGRYVRDKIELLFQISPEIIYFLRF